MSGNFFAVGAPQWAEACKVGLNPAVTFLVLARGTGRDNATTRWSAESVRCYAGMSWLRAKAAVDVMDCNPTLVASVTVKGKRPTRKLAVTEDSESLMWLPNELVTGAGQEAPPVAKLRQSQNLEHLQTFIELYAMQDLAGDGGLPRKLIDKPFEREKICEQGPFIVYGFCSDGTRNCRSYGPLGRFDGRKEGKEYASWVCLEALENMGLLEMVDYLAESDSPDAELLHPLTGGADAEAVAVAAYTVAENLPGGFSYGADNFDYVLPVLRHIANPAVVGVSRLTYRPHTKRTAAWYAQHSQACAEYEARYRALAEGDFEQAARTG